VGTTLRRLPGLVAAAAAAVAATGLLWRPSGHPVPVGTTRGQTAQLAGDGLYHYDTVSTAAFTPAEAVGPIAGFAVLGVVGARLLARLLRALPTTAPATNEVPDVPAHR
jgi:hypothetical protein